LGVAAFFSSSAVGFDLGVYYFFGDTSVSCLISSFLGVSYFIYIVVVSFTGVVSCFATSIFYGVASFGDSTLVGIVTFTSSLGAADYVTGIGYYLTYSTFTASTFLSGVAAA